jgi:hypothetical protein
LVKFSLVSTPDKAGYGWIVFILNCVARSNQNQSVHKWGNEMPPVDIISLWH